MIPTLVALYLAAIVAANLLLAVFGPRVAPLNGFALIAFDLATRDRLHTAWAGRGLWARMLALVGAGGALSLALAYATTAAPPDVVARIAWASCAAFVAAGLADAAVFAAGVRLPWLARANLSNVAGAAADSAVFGLLAGLPPAVILTLFAAKVAGGLLWSVALRPRQAAPAAA